MLLITKAPDFVGLGRDCLESGGFCGFSLV